MRLLAAVIWALLSSPWPAPARGQPEGGVRLEVNTHFVNTEESFQDLVVFQAQVPAGCVFWELSVLDSGGALVQRFRSRSRPPRDLFWFGSGLDGRVIPDGFYRARLKARCEDGNETESRETRFSFLIPPSLSALRQSRLSIHEDAGKFVVRLPDLIFAAGQDALSPSASVLLEDVSVFLKSHPRRPVIVLGFTDDTGTPEGNQALSERRAWRVYRSLIERGIEPARLRHRGRGSQDPLASNATDAGRARNRRVEVWMSKAHHVGS